MAEDENYIHFSRLTMCHKQWEVKRQVISGAVWEGKGSHSMEGGCHTLKHSTLMGTFSESRKNNVLLEHKGRD